MAFKTGCPCVSSSSFFVPQTLEDFFSENVNCLISDCDDVYDFCLRQEFDSLPSEAAGHGLAVSRPRPPSSLCLKTKEVFPREQIRASVLVKGRSGTCLESSSARVDAFSVSSSTLSSVSTFTTPWLVNSRVSSSPV